MLLSSSLTFCSDRLKFVYKWAGQDRDEVSIKDWMDGLQGGQVDHLPRLDWYMQNEVGKLDKTTEYVLGTQRPAAIFELRDLGSTTASTMENSVKEAEDAVIAFHKKYQQAPTQWPKREERLKPLKIAGQTERKPFQWPA